MDRKNNYINLNRGYEKICLKCDGECCVNDIVCDECGGIGTVLTQEGTNILRLMEKYSHIFTAYHYNKKGKYKSIYKDKAKE